jgi:NADH-quinone oxidoreductase subunit H
VTSPETIDQIFVVIKHWLMGYVPGVLQPISSASFLSFP